MSNAAPRHFVIGTAGHVDHGKTTLVQALTGVDTDRLPEEKRRGITIELGFAPLSLPGGISASIVDVPGHRRLVHTMIGGAIGIQLVLLVVAADEGVMPQTREHLAACELLGLDRAVVALTKSDRATPDLIELARDEIGGLLADRFDHRIVAVSARTGEGIDDLKRVLEEALAACPPPIASDRAALAIDRSFSIKGAGAVVTGTLVRGTLRVGEAVHVVSSRAARKATVRGLHVHGVTVETAQAPARLALNLGQLEKSDLARGDLVTTDPAAEATMAFDASLRMVGKVRRGVEHEVYVGTARTRGRIVSLTEPENGAVLARLDLLEAIPVLGGDRFVVRSSTSAGPDGAVVAGGVVLDARASRPRKRDARVRSLAALASGDATGVVRALAEERAPGALVRRDLAGRHPIAGSRLERAADKLADTGELVRVREDGWIARATLAELASRVALLVARHHEENPLDRGIRLETLRQKLGPRAGAAVADEAIRHAARRAAGVDPTIVVEADVARRRDFVDGSAPRFRDALEAVARALRDSGLKGLGDFAIRETCGDDVAQHRAILAKLERDGVVLTTGGQWFDAAIVEELRRRVIDHYAEAPLLTIAQFKALSGLGRKQAIPLLELFDREGITRRQGDDRLPGPRTQTPS